MVLSAVVLDLFLQLVHLHLYFHLEIEFQSDFALGCFPFDFRDVRISSWLVGDCIRISLEKETFYLAGKVEKLGCYSRNRTSLC